MVLQIASVVVVDAGSRKRMWPLKHQVDDGHVIVSVVPDLEGATRALTLQLASTSLIVDSLGASSFYHPPRRCCSGNQPVEIIPYTRQSSVDIVYAVEPEPHRLPRRSERLRQHPHRLSTSTSIHFEIVRSPFLNFLRPFHDTGLPTATSRIW